MVYVVQEVQGRNTISARQFGDMTVLLPDGEIVLSPGPTVRKLKRRLQDFSDTDYLLLMGDPVAIGIACMVAGEANQGRVKLLKWDRQNHCYYPVNVDVHQRLES